MESKEIQPPRVTYAVIIFNKHFKTDIYDSNNNGLQKWHNFLKECGISHVKMDKLEIVNEQKYLLAKIKYGFDSTVN